jgi:hypothetical protein
VSIASELGTVIKRIFLVSEELTRLSSEVKELSRDVNNHEVRLAVIENTLSLASRPSKLILPGN